MPVTINGIRIRSLTVTNEEGAERVRCDYELVSSNGAVMAKNSLTSKSEYGSETTFTPSFDTLKMLKEAVNAYKRDAEQMLGFNTPA